MEKRDIIAKVSGSTGLTMKQAEEALEVLLDQIARHVYSDRSALVEIEGFGTFYRITGSSSGNLNLTTGEITTFPGPVLSIRFRAEKSIKKLGVRFRAEGSKYIGLTGKSIKDFSIEAARNPNTPASLLENLAADEDDKVRYGAARNPNTPASALEKLAADEDKDVRSAAAGNPNTPA